MSADLAEFMVFWIFLILLFTCVIALLFDPTNHMTFFNWLYFYYNAALGDFNNNVYIVDDIHGELRNSFFRFG